MIKDTPTIQQIRLMFAGLNAANKINVYPKAGTLKDALNILVDTSSTNSPTASQSIITNFATASIEMWHKSIHSFLISASLTTASPIWASIAGYYSSHFAMRGFAHLLGNFLLYSRNKKVIKLEINPQPLCHIIQKTSRDGEHRFYWTKVHNHPDFNNDPFFTINNENLDQSDCGHRNKTNYFDHIYTFPQFQVLDAEVLKKRVKIISGIPFYDAPIPNKHSFPDIESVQLVAYYRLIKFRSFLDEILDSNHHYWRYNRNPLWCSEFIKYQTIQTEHSVLFNS